MRNRGRSLTAIIAGCFILLISACGNINMEAGLQETKNIVIEETQQSTVIEETINSYYIYVSANGTDYQRLPYEAEQVTPESLIEAIAQKTGWNLKLAQNVISEKDGMTVVFDSEASLFDVNYTSENEQFASASREDFVAAVLGSVQKTLKYFASPEAPETVNIYFTANDGEALVVEDIIELPKDLPYSYEYWHEKQ